MSIDKVIAPLLRVPLFAGLTSMQLAEIANHTERITFRRGTTITEAGAPGDGAYLIVAGDAVCKSERPSAIPPQPIELGSLIGELAMLVDHIYGVTVVADGRVHCLKILRAALYQQMEADPELADHFSSLLAARLNQAAIEMRRIDQLLAGPGRDALAASAAPTTLPSGPLDSAVSAII